MRRRSLIQLAAATLAAASLGAHAQAFPAKPIRLVIAFPAGGPTDITMRQLADNAGKILGQPVIVENKPGAGGTLPAQMLQSSPADGYTVAQIPLGVFRLPYTTKMTWIPSRTSTTSSTSRAMPSASSCRPRAPSGTGTTSSPTPRRIRAS